jgi:hypothetical protein
MTRRISDRELTERLAALPREIRPEHDPWEDIRKRISRPAAAAASRRRFNRRPLVAIAAAVMLAVTAGILFSLKTSETQVAGGDAQWAAAHGDSAWPRGLAVSEAEYLAAFREFIPVGHSRESLPAKAVEKIELGWADMQSAETALAAALKKNPDDNFLNNRMLELRARQLGFLKQLATLELSNRRLTI